MRRGAMAILLDRAFVQPPVDPLKAKVGSAYRTALSKAHAYELNSSAQWRRPAEVLGFVYFYRAARKVKNLPAGVKAGTYLTKMKAAADTILTYYQDDCFEGHCGNGAGGAVKCARFNHTSGESDDLKYARKYRCNGGERCYDSGRGPWWTAWHSAYNDSPYNRIG